MASETPDIAPSKPKVRMTLADYRAVKTEAVEENSASTEHHINPENSATEKNNNSSPDNSQLSPELNGHGTSMPEFNFRPFGA